MKNYDETVDTVFDRIRAYNVKKKRRTVLACRITAACCAVTLLGGSVWYLNRPTHDIPVTITPDENEVTATTTTANTTTTAPTTTEKLLITADEPDYYAVDYEFFPEEPQNRISPALQKKMETYRDANAVYSVLVAISPKTEDDLEPPGNNKELLRLEEKKRIAYDEYEEILKRDNPSGPSESDKGVHWVHSEEALEKKAIYLSLHEEYEALYHKLVEEYVTISINRQVDMLTSLSETAPQLLSHTEETSTINIAVNLATKQHAYSAILSANSINELAKLGGFMFWLDSPSGDYSYEIPFDAILN